MEKSLESPTYRSSETQHDCTEPAVVYIGDKHAGTVNDHHDMHILGRIQELRRNFKYVSVVAFGCTNIGTWQFVLDLIQYGLTDGGTAGMIYGYLICFMGFVCVYMSISEMASIAPTSGGQYHWVSEFAPAKWQKYLSYLSGWLVFAGWQFGLIEGCFLSGSIIQGMLALNIPDYTSELWQGTLLVMGVAAFSIIFNTFFGRALAFIESILLAIYILGFFAVLITLWVLAPRSSAHAVFTEFNDGGGWSSNGAAVMVGLSGLLPSLEGFDCVVHMAEEIHDASRTIPISIMTGLAVNGMMGLVMLLTVCFTLGDVKAILETKSLPFIQLFYNTTQSYPATNFLTSIVLIVFISSVIAGVATSSRQLWSFARDGGFPSAHTLAKVHRGLSVPLNAIMASLTLIVLISLINLGSPVALNAIVSLANSSILSSYILTTACLLVKRIKGEQLPKRRWSLGRYGLIVNALSLVFLCPLFVFVFFPLTKTVDATTFNWGSAMFTGVIIISTIYYFVGGQTRYTPPASIVRRTADDYDGAGE